MQKKEVEKILDQIEKIYSKITVDYQQIFSNAKKQIEKNLEDLAGSNLEIMKGSIIETEKNLNHINPKLRCAAIIILCDYFFACQERLSTLETILREDADENVRLTVLDCISRCYMKRKNNKITKLLATIVYDDSESLNFRIPVYNSLFLITGMPVEKYPLFLLSKGLFRFPEDVDWEFVKRFY